MQRLHALWLELDRVRHDLEAAAVHVAERDGRLVELAEEAEVAVRPHDFLRAYA